MTILPGALRGIAGSASMVACERGGGLLGVACLASGEDHIPVTHVHHRPGTAHGKGFEVAPPGRWPYNRHPASAPRAAPLVPAAGSVPGAGWTVHGDDVLPPAGATSTCSAWLIGRTTRPEGRAPERAHGPALAIAMHPRLSLHLGAIQLVTACGRAQDALAQAPLEAVVLGQDHRDASCRAACTCARSTCRISLTVQCAWPVRVGTPCTFSRSAMVCS